MHNAEQLRFWGPLPQVSKFFGERQNGQLQSIQTNGILCMFQMFRLISTALTMITDQMDLTMLRTIVRRQRFHAYARARANMAN
jgi:hypothetical protein